MRARNIGSSSQSSRSWWLLALPVVGAALLVARCEGPREAHTKASASAHATAALDGADGMTAAARRAAQRPLTAKRGAGPLVSRPDYVETPSGDQQDPESQRIAQQKLTETIDFYRTTMELPLWSRPATAATPTLATWSKGARLGQPFAVDDKKREIRADAWLDRYFVAPGEAVTVTIACTQVEDGAPVAPVQVDAQLEWRDPASATWVAAGQLPLVAGPAGWSGSAVPSTIAALQGAVRELRVVAYVQLGEFEKQFELPVLYAAAQPLVVHGIARDAIVDGSLQVDLDVEITTVAPVMIMATLFSGDGQTAIATYEDFARPSHVGRQRLSIRFFGKILHDARIDGPYRLGAVHGFVYRQDLDPREHHFSRADVPAMLTGRHRAADFSDAEFSSPEKDAQIQQYEALRSDLGATP